MSSTQLPRYLKIGSMAVIAMGVTAFLVMGESPTPEDAQAISSTSSQEESGAELSQNNEPVDDASRDSTAEELPELPMAHTVSDIDVRGGVHIDQQGNLIQNQQLRQFLEFFMGQTSGPEDEEAMRAHMTAAMEQQGIPAEVQQQVMDTLDTYLAYHEEKDDLMEQMGEESQHTVDTFREVQSLRRTHLGRELAEAFYGREEARTETRLAERRLMNDDTLDETTREQLLRELESDLPESTQEVRERSRQVTELNHQVQEMRADGASEQEIQAARQEAVGHEAAEQLAEVDEERAEWDQRMEQYQQEREALENNEGLSREDRDEAISDLREDHFDSEAERRRARALERIAESGEMENSS